VAPGDSSESLLPSADGIAAQLTDPAAVIAFLAERAATEDRDAQATLSLAYADTLAKREQEEVDAMNAEAGHLMLDAVVTASFGLAAGLGQVCAALVTPTTNAAGTPKPNGSEANDFQGVPQATTRIPDLLRATAKVFDASKDGVGVMFKSWLQEDEIDQKRATFSAQLAQQAMDESRRAVGDYQASMGRALDYVKAFLDMRHQSAVVEAQRA
jgi:hypothetical protein